MGVIIFNGKSTEQLGLISQAVPSYEFPKKNYKYTHIPGRNGDLITDLHSYENVNRTYYIASIYKSGSKLIENARAIIDWLTSAKGYCRLEDSYEPDIYRMASYVDSGSLTDIYETATTLNITFNCKPQKYLKLYALDGETEVEKIEFTTNSLTINNPTGYDALPLIIFTPRTEGEKTITVNSNNFIINVDADLLGKVIYIDSEIQHCYTIENGKMVNKNKQFTIKEFPVLTEGNNTITFPSTGIQNISIKPRWWRL